MADGKGGAGAGVIPALAGNPRLAAGVYPVTLVVRGRGAMPGFTDLLSPAQIAAVVTYVRTDFGNHFEKPVSEAEVKAIEGAKTGP
jgi:mono/diheme cytochrome c family protein